MIKILFADDSKMMLEIAKIMLEKSGYTVVTATNGKEAVDLAEKEKPDIIFLDAEMPEMDGWETCQYLKSKPETGNVPVIMCTGHESEEYRQKGSQLGASGYVTKPYNFELIKQKISELIAK